MLNSSFLQLFCNWWAGSDCLLWTEQSHFSLTVRQRGRFPWGRPLCIFIITKTKVKSKRQIQHGICFPIVIPHCQCLFHNLVRGNDHSNCFIRMDLSGSVHHWCQCSKCWDLSLFPPLESAFFVLVDLKIFTVSKLSYVLFSKNFLGLQTQEATSQVKEFHATCGKIPCCYIKIQEFGLTGNHSFWYTSQLTKALCILYSHILSFLRAHHRESGHNLVATNGK